MKEELKWGIVMGISGWGWRGCGGNSTTEARVSWYHIFALLELRMLLISGSRTLVSFTTNSLTFTLFKDGSEKTRQSTKQKTPSLNKKPTKNPHKTYVFGWVLYTEKQSFPQGNMEGGIPVARGGCPLFEAAPAIHRHFTSSALRYLIWGMCIRASHQRDLEEPASSCMLILENLCWCKQPNDEKDPAPFPRSSFLLCWLHLTVAILKAPNCKFQTSH